MASSRVDDYSLKLESLKRNPKKYAAEIKKLTLWMHKHQSDSVTDASKQRLVDILSDSTKVLNEDASELLQTYLALPEGKLTTSKGKARALKWLESLAEKGDEKKSEKGQTHK